MSDEKYTQKEREFLKLHELGHILMRLEQAVIAQVGPRGPVNKSSNDRLRAWYALDVLKDVLQFQLPANKMNEARDFVINKELLGINAAYANMTAPEIFQDLIAPTTEDNDDE